MAEQKTGQDVQQKTEQAAPPRTEKTAQEKTERVTEQIGKVTLDYTLYPGKDLYCDGAAEDELLEIVKKYSHADYQKVIEERRNWPVLYHLSPLRENIVDWLPLEGKKVLEVGAGCGAITGALARRAGGVTCVELSKKRSLINAWRNRECENVTIHVGNFSDIEPQLPEDYDCICLIGVFEYARSYINAEEPYEEFLRILLRHLAPQGRLVIAIENKYGMKYFAGCREDHLGNFFSGIENYGEGGVRTFGRRGLEKIFAACGANKYSFYYPYPDYKFMSVLYSDEYLPEKGELNRNICNYDYDRMLLFDESKAYDGVLEEGMYPFFANSFLVVIGPEPEAKYVKYSNDRAPEYRIRTEIGRDMAGWINVKKYPLSEGAADHIRGMAGAYEMLCRRYEGGNLQINRCRLHEKEKELWASFEFVPGVTLSELMDECLEREDLDGFHALFREYVERIGYHQEYPVSDFDMVFSNIIVDGDKWTVIDYEWTFGKEMEIRELAFRAVLCYLLENEKRDRLNLELITKELGITEEEEREYRAREKDFQQFVTGKSRAMADIYGLMRRRAVKPSLVSDRIQIYEDTGEGFSEENSYVAMELYPGEQGVNLDFEVKGDVQVFRIDPSMEPCVVRIDGLTFNGQEIPLGNKKLVYTNGRMLKGTQSFLFAAADPNIYIRVADLDVREENTLSASMRIIKLPQDIAGDMAGAVKKLI